MIFACDLFIEHNELQLQVPFCITRNIPPLYKGTRNIPLNSIAALPFAVHLSHTYLYKRDRIKKFITCEIGTHLHPLFLSSTVTHNIFNDFNFDILGIEL